MREGEIAKMESKFKVGDLVWAKMKGFPAWPAKMIEPKEEVRRPSDKKLKNFVYFFGSENYAWIPQECLWQYIIHKEKFTIVHRIPRGFREAMEAAEDALKKLPEQDNVSVADLPSIAEELALMRGADKSVKRTYSGSKAKKYLLKKNPRRVGRPSLKSLHGSPDMRSPRVPDRQRITSRLDRALNRSSAVVVKKRLGRPPSVSRRVDIGEGKNEGDVGVDVGASGESGNIGKSADSEEEEEEDLEVSFKMPNEGGDYLRCDDEVMGNGEVALSQGEGGDTDVTQIKPIERDDMESDTDIEDSTNVDQSNADVDQSNAEVDQSNAEVDQSNAEVDQSNAEVDQSNAEVDQSNAEVDQSNAEVDQSNVEVDQSNAEVDQSNAEVDQSNVEVDQSNADKCVEEMDSIECTFTDDVSVDVVTEEVVECTMNIDPSDGIELVETTVPSEDACIPVNDSESNICDSPEVSGSGEHREASPYLFDAIKANKLLSTDNAMQDVVASTDSDVLPVTETVDHSEAPMQSSCETEETEDSTEDESVSLAVEQMRERQENEIAEIKDTQLTLKEKKEEAKLKKIRDRKSREFQAALHIKVKPSPRKRQLTSPISLASTITPKRSKMPAIKLSSSKRRGNSLSSASLGTTQNDFKPILEMMQQSTKLPRVSDSEDQEATQDDYSDRLADLSGIDFALPQIPHVKNIIATPMKIGFLGLGAMGSGMVTNLLNSGHEVTVWNRTPSSCREFVKIGALKGNSPSEVVTSCDMTFSCVSDPSALKDLVFGNCGVLQGIGPGKAYIDMSTVDVETITDVHEAVTTRGGRFLEAPVIGSRQPAMGGQLLIMAAGDRTLFDDCYSCLEAMGRQTFFLGEVGSATKMKLVISMLMGTVLAGLAESMALAEHIGLDQEEVLKILTLSPVSCPLVRTKGKAMMQAQFSNPHCRLHLCQKDLRLAVNMSDTVEQPLHVASAVNELFKKAKAKGYGEHDSAAVYRAADL